MSMIYKKGKVTVSQGSTKLVGIGTKFLNPIFNIFTGQIVQIRTGDKVLVNTIDEVVSDTEIKLAFDSPESATDVDYVILMTTVDSISDAANKIVAMTKHSAVLANLMVDWFTLTGDIEMTLPDGSKITVMSITEIQDQLSQKATKDSTKGFYKLYKSKEEADADLINRVDGDQVLIWSDDKSTYGFYKVSLGKFELVESERKVSTINNVKPDDTGNVQITLPGGNPSLWLGEVTWFPYDQGGVGYSGLLPADGQEHKRVDYPDTWSAIEKGLIASVSESKWKAGENLVFSTGNGSTTFRVPNLMQGQSISAAKKGDKGSKVLEQIPYIKMINGKAPDTSGNITIDIPTGEIEKRVESYSSNDAVNWKGAHSFKGDIKSGNSESSNLQIKQHTGRYSKIENTPHGADNFLNITKNEADGKMSHAYYLPQGVGVGATREWVNTRVREFNSDATTTQKGIVQLSASVGTSTTKVAHEKAVSDALEKKAGADRFIASGNETQVKNAGGDYFKMSPGGYAGAVNKEGDLIFEFTPGGVMNAGMVPFACGGTGAKDKAGALKNLGLESALLLNPDNISVKSDLNNYTAPGAYAFNNDAVGSNFPDIWGGNLYVDKDPIYSGRGWQTYRVYATTDIYRRSPKASGQWTPWVKEWNTGNAKPDTNGWLKVSSPIIEVYPSGHYETNDESEGAEVSRTGTGQYHITGILGYNSDGAWGVNGGISVPKDNNGLELVYVDDRVKEDGSLIIETCHRQHAHLPERFQNWRLKEVTPEGERIFYQDGEPCDLPESTRLDVRVGMPAGSIYNIKQKEWDSTRSPIIFDKGTN